MNRTLPLLGAALSFALLARTQAAAPTTAAPATPDNQILEVPGKSGVYQVAHKNIWLSTVIVTNDGIIMVDPINTEAATWFKAEARKRWNKEVRYLINSHGHYDHSAGGQVYDKAIVVAQDNFWAENLLETQGEKARKPDLTFSDHMTITHGGETVELYHWGKDHGNAMVYVYHPRTKTLTTVDVMARERLPYNDLPYDDPQATIDTLKKIEAMDVDLILPGHGNNATRADATRERGYWELLRASVQAHIINGKSLDEIRQLVPQQMSAYSGWQMWQQWGPNNIVAMHRILTAQGVKAAR